MAAGYSGTQLAKKLGLKPGHTLVLRHVPRGWLLPDIPDGVQTVRDAVGEADVALAFFREKAVLADEATVLAAALRDTAALWILWPRKAAGHVSDITENDLRDLFLLTGLVDVKVAAVGEDWSGLKFVRRKENRRR
ncbi:DUF3052 family protein [Yinghuangia aomiensis]